MQEKKQKSTLIVIDDEKHNTPDEILKEGENESVKN